MEDLKNLTKRVFQSKAQTPEKPPRVGVIEKKKPLDFADSDDEDAEYGNDDNLQDDIEDKNASFAGGAILSTNNTSRSGNSSGSDKSTSLVSRILKNRAARKKREDSMFGQIVAKFSKLLSKNAIIEEVESNSSE